MIEYKRRLNRTHVDSSCVNRLIDNDRGNTCLTSLFIAARKRSCGKIMFSVVSVCDFGRGAGAITCDHCPWFIRPHHTGTPSLCTSPLRSCPSLANDMWWPTQETCWNLFTWRPAPPPAPTGTHPTGMLSCCSLVLVSGLRWTIDLINIYVYGWLNFRIVLFLNVC